MSQGPLLDEILRALLRRHLTDAEVYVKRGRSRRLERTPVTETSCINQERAWAVRAGNRRGAFFTAATGDAEPAGPWPEPVAGAALELPEAAAAPAWTTPADFDTPLIGEREGLRLLEGLGRQLEAELPGARVLRAVLEDGSSEAELANSRGLRASTRSRISTFYIEAVGPGSPAPTASLYVAAREPRQFHPTALARRLADRLAVSAAGAPPERDAGEFLLAPGRRRPSPRGAPAAARGTRSRRASDRGARPLRQRACDPHRQRPLPGRRLRVAGGRRGRAHARGRARGGGPLPPAAARLVAGRRG